MKTCSQILLAAVSCLVLSCTYAERQVADGGAYEIIVKFASDQTINEIVTQAFDDTDAEASLEKPVNGLSKELGVPFVYSRLTSGKEIVVDIPAMQVYKKVIERIRDSDEVENATLEKHANDEILVTLVSGSIESGRNIDANVFAAHLINDDRFPVSCEVRPDGRLAVTPDFERLVGVLAKNLANRSDIDYAQPNHQVRHYNNTQ